MKKKDGTERGKKNVYTDNVKLEVVGCLRYGLSYAEIERAFSIPASTLRVWRMSYISIPDKAKEKLAETGKYPESFVEKVTGEFRKGHSVKWISEIYAIPRWTVRSWVKNRSEKHPGLVATASANRAKAEGKTIRKEGALKKDGRGRRREERALISYPPAGNLPDAQARLNEAARTLLEGDGSVATLVVPVSEGRNLRITLDDSPAEVPVKKKGDRYTREFRDYATRLVFAGHRPCTEVARELGLSYWTLQGWVKEEKRKAGEEPQKTRCVDGKDGTRAPVARAENPLKQTETSVDGTEESFESDGSSPDEEKPAGNREEKGKNESGTRGSFNLLRLIPFLPAFRRRGHDGPKEEKTAGRDCGNCGRCRDL